MGLDDLGIFALLALIIVVLVVEFAVVAIVAGFIASWFGVSGILWWAIAIVVFLLINGILSALARVGSK